ncbi:N-acetylmannosamine-6-phosphate 2-epimerase [uncultured Tessaracoccus sp.]|uniref:N-acetylmannosamine-6-phosphate 2-epimerase n=1 Tax=uncultured Tessaracoccus sp. TaxID=905023 RepID=UPI0025CF148A|nr:N-acetylmannosamine-6-phosphate 2-epimerase [uncultured Tessaracoccus sp.]
MNPLLQSLRGTLIVSCQAYPGEPMRHPETMAQIAQAVVEGGASAVRLQGLDDIRLTRGLVDVPVIGLVKQGHEGVFITPTLEIARATADAGSHVVALDATTRPRPDGLTLAQTVEGLRDSHPEVLVMADCDSFESAQHAVDAGVDVLGTTLAGYTGARPKTDGPDLELLARIAQELPLPVIAEGRIHRPDQARACIDAGAHACVVGTAITHPTTITGWFRDAVVG